MPRNTYRSLKEIAVPNKPKAVFSDNGKWLLGRLKSKKKEPPFDPTSYECDNCGFIYDITKLKTCPECGLRPGYID